LFASIFDARGPRPVRVEDPSLFAGINGCRGWTTLDCVAGMRSALTHLEVRSLAVLSGALPASPIRDERIRR
jgi:hypothetical protein